MSADVQIGGSAAHGWIFPTTDKVIALEVLDGSDVPVDVSGWTVTFVVRATDSDMAILISVTATIAGSWSATRSVNTQRANVTLAAADLGTLSPRTYRYSAKRTDSGYQDVIARGDFVVSSATQQ